MKKIYAHQEARINIARQIATYGPMTREKILDVASSGSRSPSDVKRTLASMIADEQLIKAAGVIDLTVGIKNFLCSLKKIEEAKFSEMSDVVKPATPMPFRTINAKYIPSAAGRRPGTEARDIRFIALSSNVPAHRVQQ